MTRSNLILITLLFTVSLVSGQPGDPNGGGPPGVPVTGVEILLAAGGLLGIKKLINSKKNKS